VVKALLAGGAEVRAADNEGHDVLWWAQCNPGDNKEKIVQILKEYASFGK
jgi:hypothetical protein